MLISINWLKDFVDIGKTSPKKLGELLTMHTAEVEKVDDFSGKFKKMVVGKILKIRKHPNADKLKIVETDIGKKTLQIVCGGKNLRENMLVPVALPGAEIKWHGEGEPVELKSTKIRGVKSEGMICAGEEIGLEKSQEQCIMDISYTNEKAGTALAKALNLDDAVLEIENKSLTHRPDLWGHYGIAREVAAILEKSLQPFKPPDIQKPKPSNREKLDIQVENTKLCPRYCGILIKNIKIAKSPQWMQSRLQATGYRPINNIVDITNYVMAELGQPLHAFDIQLLNKGIIVRNAKPKEKIKTLDGEEHILDEDMLVIADHEKAVALAGIMGSENSEINEKTAAIIIESANFDPVSVRKTSQKLNLRTESVQRFEKSLDPHLAETAIKRTVELILNISPQAEIASDLIDIKNFEDKKIKVKLNLSRVNSKIGKKIPKETVMKILKSLEFSINQQKNELQVEIPSFRATKDIDIEDDLVEEIARIYGYENIKTALPDLPIKLPIVNRERHLKHQARTILSLGLGFIETSNYSFYGEAEVEKCRLHEKNHVRLKNFLSSDQTHLRTSLLPNILKNIPQNTKNYDKFKIYEIGRVYHEIGEYMPKEEKYIAGIIVSKTEKKELFYDAKGYAEEFLKRLKIDQPKFEEAKNKPSYTHPAKCIDIYVQKKQIGQVFELHPAIAQNFEIQSEVAAFEINFSLLASLPQIETKYKPLPKFPGLEFDISVIVNSKKTVKEINETIQKSEKNLIQKIELFDIFEDESIGKDKKAFAFHILLQSDERTLTDYEMTKVREKVCRNLEKVEGKIRGN